MKPLGLLQRKHENKNLFEMRGGGPAERRRVLTRERGRQQLQPLRCPGGCVSGRAVAHVPITRC